MSASQDGKLIVWDGYTTNKVRKDDLNDFNFCLMNVSIMNWDTEYCHCLSSFIVKDINLCSLSSEMNGAFIVGALDYYFLIILP